MTSEELKQWAAHLYEQRDNNILTASEYADRLIPLLVASQMTVLEELNTIKDDVRRNK